MNSNRPPTQENNTQIEKSKKNVLPLFVKLDSEILASNTATIAAYVNDVAYVYYILIPDGAKTPTEIEIVKQTYPSPIRKGIQRTQPRFPNGTHTLSVPCMNVSFTHLEP